MKDAGSFQSVRSNLEGEETWKDNNGWLDVAHFDFFVCFYYLFVYLYLVLRKGLM